MTAILDKRQQRELELEQMLQDYILNSHLYRFGGMVNLISTIRKIVDDEFDSNGLKDYETASTWLRELEDKMDTLYFDGRHT